MCGILGNCQRSRMREAVVRADHKIVKCVAGIQSGVPIRHRRIWQRSISLLSLHFLKPVVDQLGSFNSRADDKLHIHRAVHHTDHQSIDCAGETRLKPVTGIGIVHTNGKQAFLIGKDLGITHPGIIGRFRHFRLQLSKNRLPGLFCFHDEAPKSPCGIGHWGLVGMYRSKPVASATSYSFTIVSSCNSGNDLPRKGLHREWKVKPIQLLLPYSNQSRSGLPHARPTLT